MVITFNNCKIRAISGAVPKGIVNNATDHPDLDPEEVEKTIQLTGVKQYRKSSADVCASDLCEQASKQLLAECNIDPKTIQGLLFVTQTPDYKAPSTACLLQDKLGLPIESIAYDINLGCSGFIYGLFTACSFLQNATLNRILLCCGDTQTKLTYEKDKNVNFLLGDGGSAILIEKDEQAPPITFNLFTDGSRYDKLIVPAGGCRIPSTEETRRIEKQADDQFRSQEHMYLSGMDVFQFSAMDVVKTLKNFLTSQSKSAEDFDYICLHQANRFMTDKITRKLKFTPEQALYSIECFGNTSNASIPLSLCYEWQKRPITGSKKVLLSGFGIGLSWGIIDTTIQNTQFFPIQEV